MAAVAQQAITGLGKALEIPSLQQGVQPQQHRQIDIAGGVLPARQALLPALHPGLAQALSESLLQALLNRAQQLRRLIQELQGLQMQIKIAGARSTNADGVNARIAEAKEIVEHDRVQGLTKLEQPRRRAVQMAAFIGGTDQEHAHVPLPRSG